MQLAMIRWSFFRFNPRDKDEFLSIASNPQGSMRMKCFQTFGVAMSLRMAAFQMAVLLFLQCLQCLQCQGQTNPTPSTLSILYTVDHQQFSADFNCNTNPFRLIETICTSPSMMSINRNTCQHQLGSKLYEQMTKDCYATQVNNATVARGSYPYSV